MSLFIDIKSIVAATEAPTTYAPRLGAENLFRTAGATVTASAEVAGGEKENAYAEGFSFDFWRPGAAGTQWLRVSLDYARPADYLGIAAHDLADNECGVKLQYSTDGGSTWADATGEHIPADSAPLMVLFDEITAKDWRVLFTSTGAVSIGAVSFGKALAFNAPISGGFMPPYLSRSNRYVNDVAEGGQYLGRSLIAEGSMLNLEMPGVSMVWLREYWEPTVRIIEQYPFFFAARDADAVGSAEAEVFYGWAVGQPSSGYAGSVQGALRLQARGIVT